MVAQIERTERWLDQCCRPVFHGLKTIGWARYSYVQDAVFEMETSHPEAVAAMLSFSTAIWIGLGIGEDGKMRSFRSRKVFWEPDVPAQLTGIFGDYIGGAPSAAAVSIYLADAFSTHRQPYCFELPQTILDVVAANPAGAIAESYYRYVRTALVPGVRAVGELLKAHAATIEWPPIEWLAEQFPDVPWSARSNASFGEQWTGYARSWGRVLAQWDAENFTIVRPAGPMPFAGLQRAIDWSRTRGEAKQRELIGMTAEAEVDIAYLASYGDKTAQPPSPAAGTLETTDT
jgi:hypothetical protein